MHACSLCRMVTSPAKTPIAAIAQRSIAASISAGGVVIGGSGGSVAAGWVWSQVTVGGGVGGT